jgi:hypothetical protein
MTGDQVGSIIWSATWKNKSLIHDHRFWEIRDGRSTLFWAHSWQQLPKLHSNPRFLSLKADVQEMHGSKVHHYWANDPVSLDWWSWSLNPYHIPLCNCLHVACLQNELFHRKIKFSMLLDRLRWGLPSSRALQSERSLLHTCLAFLPLYDIWAKIWKANLWPKVATFLWLVAHGKILTQDHLLHRGFSGPGLCTLCHNGSESVDHLLSLAPSIRPSGIKESSLLDNPIRTLIPFVLPSLDGDPMALRTLNWIWQLFPSFVLWEIWKERNRHIFKDESLQLPFVWARIKQDISETVLVAKWNGDAS